MILRMQLLRPGESSGLRSHRPLPVESLGSMSPYKDEKQRDEKHDEDGYADFYPRLRPPAEAGITSGGFSAAFKDVAPVCVVARFTGDNSSCASSVATVA